MKTSSILWASALTLFVAGCAGMGADGSAPSVEIADGDAAFARAQHRVAIGHYTRAIDSGGLAGPDLIEAYAKRGTAYVTESDTNGGIDANLVAALDDYSKVRAAVPGFQPAAMGEARAYQALGGFAEALQSYRQAYELDQRDHYWSLLGIGATYRLAGDYETAMRYYNHALRTAGPPGGGMPVYYHRGLALFASGKYQDAIDSLSSGIPQQRGYAWAYVYRACSYARIGDYAKSLTDYDAAIVFLRRSGAEYGNSAFWQKSLERLSAERAGVFALARGNSSAIPVSTLCEQYDPKRQRSTLLPASDGKLPDLGILPDGGGSTPGI